VNLPIFVSGLAAYLGVGWYLYVPYAVANRTRGLCRSWNAEALDADFMAAHWRLCATLNRVPTVEERNRLWAQMKAEAVRCAPVEQMRGEAARRWPLYCLIWLPAILALIVWAASVWVWRTLTSRAVVRAAGPAAKPPVPVGESEIERLERELEDEFGIVFGGEVTP
jgi:HAMP domain-containing protein